MGTEFFLLAALAIAVAVLGKRASVKTYGVMAAAAVLAAILIYQS